MSENSDGGLRPSRRDVLGGLGAGATAALAGCSSLTGGGGSTSLDFWLFGGIPAERDYISSHTEDYEEYDVNYAHQEWGEKYQIIASAAANDNLPDVMAGQCQQIPDYVGAGALQPLDQEEFQEDLEEINDRFIQANVDTLHYTGLGGYEGERQWALPGGYADLGPFVDGTEEVLRYYLASRWFT